MNMDSWKNLHNKKLEAVWHKANVDNKLLYVPIQSDVAFYIIICKHIKMFVYV